MKYRGVPFWAWNAKLDAEELVRQIRIFKEMGFGGFHMHVRTGMDTPYLTDEYMDRVEDCVEHARENEMLAWLYDEDRWPSGAAGGIVTREEKYRARHLLFTTKPSTGKSGTESREMSGAATRSDCGWLLACYDVELDKEGYLISAKCIGQDEEAAHEKW